MAVPGSKKFNFVSPGIFLNEIDKSQLKKTPLGIGPVVIGRSKRGPGNRPVRVGSYAEFVQIFGSPHPGTAQGDMWRTSDGPPSPTYGAYAAQAWLANNSPLTYLRLVGRQHANAETDYGEAGWWTYDGSTKSTQTKQTNTNTTAGGAYGLWLIPSSSYSDAPRAYASSVAALQDMTPGTGTLAAVFYVAKGGIRLSGSVRDCGDGGTLATVAAGADLIQSNGADAQFTAEIYDASSVLKDKITFNFADGSAKHVRKAFNTNPTLVNKMVTPEASSKVYWLGETFEKAVRDDILAVSGNVAGDVLGLITGLADTSGNSWSNHRYDAQPAKSPWIFSQDMGPGKASFDPKNCQKLFRLVTHQAGQWDMHNLKIAIENIRPSTDDLNPYGTFTVTLRGLSDHDGEQEVIERFSGCNLNPASSNYIGARIGTQFTKFDTKQRRLRTYGQFRNRSQYVYVQLNEQLDENGLDPALVPFGFQAPPRPKNWAFVGNLKETSGVGDIYQFGTSVADHSNAASVADAIDLTGVDNGHQFTLQVPTAMGGNNTLVTVNFVLGATGTAGAAEIKIDVQGTSAATNAQNLADALNGVANAKVSSFGNAADTAATASAQTHFNMDASVTSTSKVTLTNRTAGTAGNGAIGLSRVGGKGFLAPKIADSPTATGGEGPNDGVEETNAFVVGNDLIPFSANSSDTAKIGDFGSLRPGGDNASSTFNFTGSYRWPTLTCRSSSADGGFVKANKGYFGFYAGKSASDTTFEASTLDLLRPLPSALNTETWDAGGTTTVHPFYFTLDDISGSQPSTSTKGGSDTPDPDQNDVMLWHSGSRYAGTSITYLTSGSAGDKNNVNADGVKYLCNTLGINKFIVPMHGGSDGLDITEREPFRNKLLAGSPTAKNSYVYNTIDEAIDILTATEDYEFNLAAMPGLTHAGLNERLIDVCEERGDALAVIDLPDVYTPSTENTETDATLRYGSVRDVTTKLMDRKINSSYGCTYYPWVQIQDTAAGTNLFVPPSVAALGVMGSSEAVSEPWFAPAGFNRGGLSDGAAGLPVIGVTEKLTAKQRDQLYEANINPIASFPAEGIVVFGQKTLQIQQSALDRINVRRLLIFIKKAVSRFASQVLFDQNVQVTWNRFLSLVEPFLKSVEGRLGLSDFRVILDSTTTTPELIDRNMMYAKIYLKPARAIEFIVVDFIVTNTGASFDD